MRRYIPTGGMWQRSPAIAAIAGCVAMAALLLSACGATSSGSSGPAVISITERDFHIALSTTHATAGDLVLRVHNNGPDQHELIVVPDRPGGPPVRSDGLTVNEEAIQSSEPGALDPGQPGSTRLLKLRLQPGRYLLFCNMAGHFMGGMHTVLVVSS